MASDPRENPILGTDLNVLPFLAAQEAGQYDLVTVQRPRDATVDLAAQSGRENLAQALILRLLTPRGALAELGHAAYGSRIYELIGQNKNQAIRNLCRAFVLEAVAQEPRVEPKAVDLVFDTSAETPSSLVFTLVVQPITGGGPLSLSLEVGL